MGRNMSDFKLGDSFASYGSNNKRNEDNAKWLILKGPREVLCYFRPKNLGFNILAQNGISWVNFGGKCAKSQHISRNFKTFTQHFLQLSPYEEKKKLRFAD